MVSLLWDGGGAGGAGAPGIATSVPQQGTLPRVFIHDGAGRRLGQVTTARDVDRSYLLMEPASARFICATDDPLLADMDPRQGRIVVIEGYYPYPWVGKMTVPSGNRAAEEVTVMCRSFDAVLTERFIPHQQPDPEDGMTHRGSAGSVFQKIVEETGALNPHGIAAKNSDVVPGPSYKAVLNDRSAYTALMLVARNVGFEWWLEYAVSPQQILAYAHFRPARGFDRCTVASPLVDGGNGHWTDWKIEGEATTFAQTVVGGRGSVTQAYSERPRQRQQSDATLASSPVVPAGAVHGHLIERATSASAGITRIERLRIAENLKNQDHVRTATEALIARPPIAERSMTWQVFMRGADGKAVDWEHFDVGSIISASAPTAFIDGFEGSLRIMAAQPVEELGVLNIVVEIVEGSHA